MFISLGAAAQRGGAQSESDQPFRRWRNSGEGGKVAAAPPTAVAQWAGGMLFVPDIHLQPKPRVIVGPTLVIFGA